MRVVVHYSEEVATDFDQDFFQRVAEETFRRVPLRGLSEKEEISCTVVAVSRERITALNHEYRHKDAVTDILSFSEYADTEAFENDTKPQAFLGEIFFCYDFIETASREDAVSVKHELVYVFSHGLLHLIGYDHSDEMFALQDAVTEAIMKEVE